jgi:hypothetical protein
MAEAAATGPILENEMAGASASYELSWKSLRFAGPIAFLILSVASGARTASSADRPVAQQSPATVEQPGGWQFQATAYGWLTALNGESSIRNLPPVRINMSFGDVLEKLNGAAMGSFLARNGNWMILTDLVWSKISAGAVVDLPGVRRPTVAAITAGTRVDFEMRQLIASAIVGYRLPPFNPDVDLYATAGIRYQRTKGKIEATPGLIPVTFSLDSVQQWADPTVGLALTWRITDRWFFNALADVGGFGVGSRFSTQGFASLGYRWSDSISTALGYRAIYTDYRSNAFSYRATQHGLFSSIAYHF